MELKDVLAQVADGTLSVDDALNELKKDSYEDLSFAKIDHSREARIGFPEVIFGERKTPDQVAQIAVAIYQRSGLVLGTRADAEHYDAVKAVLPDAVRTRRSSRWVSRKSRSGMWLSAPPAPRTSRSRKRPL